MKWILVIGILIAAIAGFFIVFTYLKKIELPWVKRAIGVSIIFYGMYLSTLTGSYTSFVIPGFGSIAVGTAVGATTGAAVGYLTWLVIGTVGAVTGGVGVAIGAVAMSLIGATLGGIGSVASTSSLGFGFKTITYPLVAWYFWVPIIVIGTLFLIGRRKQKKMLQELPPPDTSGN